MATIKDMFVMMVIGVMGFGVMFLFVNQIAVDNGAVIDTRMNDTYMKIQNQSAQFDTVREQLADLANNASEAGIGDFAYFGIRGMVAIMKAPFSLVSTVFNTVESVAGLFAAYIPIQIITGIGAFAMIVVIFAAIKFLTSRGQEP